MAAGYETTSTAMSYCTYVLATQPDEQIKLYDEILAVFATSLSNINSENVQQIEYFDWFVKEVLRYYPIAGSIVTRRSTKRTKINDIDIPVDIPIAVDGMSLHFDPELW